MMLTSIWVGLYWVLSSFFDHYVQSSRTHTAHKQKFLQYLSGFKPGIT
jgi:hypothetical protein